MQLLRGEVGAGGWQATCRCGWTGAWLPTQREAKAAYAVHKADEALRAALRGGGGPVSPLPTPEAPGPAGEDLAARTADAAAATAGR